MSKDMESLISFCAEKILFWEQVDSQTENESAKSVIFGITHGLRLALQYTHKVAGFSDSQGTICIADGCNRPQRSRGMCSMHYQREYLRARKERREGTAA